MKRVLLTIALLAFTSTCLSFQGMQPGPGFKKYAAGGTTTEYVGWPTTAGVPDAPVGSWANTGSAGNRVYTHPWTANKNATAISINYYQPVSLSSAAYAYLCLYNGTTLVGRVSVKDSSTTADWEERTLVEESANSLDFVNTDVLRFGICVDAGPTNFAAQDDGSTNVYMDYDLQAWDIDPPSPASFSTSGSTSDLGFVLKIEY